MKTKFLKTKKDITNWLEEYKVKNYTLIKDSTYGYVVNVAGEVVSLSDKNLQHIPVKFNIINCSFYCNYNQLTSLDFSPICVEGNFSCNHNQLTTLEFCPKDVIGDFHCDSNQLTTLEFCPNYVDGDFYCEDNQLASLEFCPKEVYGEFYCEDNPALGDIQNINNFAKIFNLHEAIVRIKKEKEQIDKELLKINSVDNVVKKSVLKV